MTVAGLLGGTFDPPHYGHLALAQAALVAGNLDELRLLPANRPPHKSRPDLTPAPHRLTMLRLLIAGDDRLRIEELELGRPGPSYTIDTLRTLARREPQTRFRLIIGADMIAEFHLWREAEAVIRQGCPLVAVRPGYALPADLRKADLGLSPAAAEVLQAGRFAMPPHPASSTAVRQAVAAGASLAELVPPAVAEYIAAQGLYRNRSGITGNSGSTNG